MAPDRDVSPDGSDGLASTSPPAADRGDQPLRCFLGAASLTLAIGVVAWFTGATAAADVAWAGGTLLGIGPAAWWVWTSVRRGRVGADVIALLALVGTLAVGEYLAGSLIAVMLATGRTLEARPRRAPGVPPATCGPCPLERAPRTAPRRRVGDLVQVVALAEVAPGDLLVVAPGEVVPVDGLVEGGVAVLDESALTGEALSAES